MKAHELQVELTERERAEARIRSSLAKKDVLLQEVHHRVKNNLQIVSSLLKLQASQLNDTKGGMLKDSRYREARNGARPRTAVPERKSG